MLFKEYNRLFFLLKKLIFSHNIMMESLTLEEEKILKNNERTKLHCS